MKTIVKWAGGKTQLLPQLLEIVPKEYNTYYEPFIGGGALYFALEPQRAVLNDLNPQLINLYKQIKERPEALEIALDEWFEKYNTAEDKQACYYFVRELYNEYLTNDTKDIYSAALMVFLNKAGYNGLYRLNKQGLYNVPFGKREKISYTYEIPAMSKLLKGAKLLNGDFEKACKGAKEGDLVFFDSPYYKTFDNYQSGGFSEDDHRRLANLFYMLTKKGVKCILTNSNEDFIKSLYQDYDIKVVEVKRMINSDANNRKGQEIIVKNYD